MTTAVNAAREYDEQWAVDRKVNEPLIQQVLTFIDLNRQRWDQDVFLKVGSCGSVGCFAGWALVLSQTGELEDTTVENIAFRARYGYRRPDVMNILGMSARQFYAIYDLVVVYDEAGMRHPTFEELCERVEQVTGVTYRRSTVAA